MFGFVLFLLVEHKVCRGNDYLKISFSREGRTLMEDSSQHLASLIPSSSGRILFPMGHLFFLALLEQVSQVAQFEDALRVFPRISR